MRGRWRGARSCSTPTCPLDRTLASSFRVEPDQLDASQSPQRTSRKSITTACHAQFRPSADATWIVSNGWASAHSTAASRGLLPGFCFRFVGSNPVGGHPGRRCAERADLDKLSAPLIPRSRCTAGNSACSTSGYSWLCKRGDKSLPQSSLLTRRASDEAPDKDQSRERFRKMHHSSPKVRQKGETTISYSERVSNRRPDGVPDFTHSKPKQCRHCGIISISRYARKRLIPLSQVGQYLGLAGRSRNGAELSSGGVDPSACIPVAVLRRRGWRRTVGTPLRGLSRPMISQ